jgi:hypothetical protein
MKKSLLFLVSLIMLVACAPKCDVIGYEQSAQPLISRWTDAVNLAKSTSRTDLAPQIQSMQAIKQDASDMKVATCVYTAHNLLISSMDSEIQGFIAFIGQQPDSVVSGYQTASQNYMNQYMAALSALQKK